MDDKANRQRERRRWRGMLYRCESTHSCAYVYYGARGIKVCEQWHDFETYYTDIMRLIGPCPDPRMSLDRIDNDGNYEPGNVRWASSWQQVLNSRVTGKSRPKPSPPVDFPRLPDDAYGVCATCGRSQRLTARGNLYQHRRRDEDGYATLRQCPGTGKPPLNILKAEGLTVGRPGIGTFIRRTG